MASVPVLKDSWSLITVRFPGSSRTDSSLPTLVSGSVFPGLPGGLEKNSYFFVDAVFSPCVPVGRLLGLARGVSDRHPFFQRLFPVWQGFWASFPFEGENRNVCRWARFDSYCSFFMIIGESHDGLLNSRYGLILLRLPVLHPETVVR